MKSKRQIFSFYVHAFKNLRRDYKKGGAPHKPILLLSIIQLFEKNLITSSKIYITPELVGYFKSTWNALVTTSHDLRFALPFYHLSSEPFWKLIPNNGCEKWIEAKSSMRSFSNLNTAVAYAEIDNELFELLKQKDSREILKITLLEKYFPESKSNFGGNDGGKYLNNLSNEIMEEEAEEYRKRIHELKKELDEENYQEEIYLRDGVFKREIPRIYNYTCCISGMRIDATVNVSMIDACHIIPFSESYNDTITNGIALCPNLHRAFDRGLISIDNNYKVMVSKKIIETNSKYSLKQFKGKKILLPKEIKFYPELANIEWHRNFHKDILF